MAEFSYVYVIRDIAEDKYMIKQGDAFGRVTVIYGDKLHAFQCTDEISAQQQLVQEQVRGRLVVIEQVDLC